MDAATATFHDLRPRLQGVAYRMLGSVSESEDIVQDVWLRWNGADKDGIDNAEAWLVATTTRISIDRLRAAKARREQYVGIWLPEPVLTEWPATPEDIEELSSEVSMAFLTVLERLSPEVRAAFLLREVFDMDYGEVAETLHKNEAACRQLVHRAKAQLRQERPQRALPSEVHQKLMRRFAEVLAQGDFAGMKSMLADTAVLMGDGGGRVTSFPKPMLGEQRITQLFYAANLRYKDALRIETGDDQRRVRRAALHQQRTGIRAVLRKRRRAHRPHPHAAQPRETGPAGGGHHTTPSPAGNLTQ